MTRALLLSSFACSAGLTACNGGASGAAGEPAVSVGVVEDMNASVDEFSIREHLEYLTGVKPAPLSTGPVTISERGSDGGRKAAAQYMKETLEAMGLPARILTFASGAKTGYNVEATLQGQPGGRHLWVSAHLDSVSNAGASDDASGLTAVLMIARSLAGKQPRDTIHFAAFDLEELGMLGSADYVSTEVQSIIDSEGAGAILGDLHHDMIGWDEGVGTANLGACGEGGEIDRAVLDSAAAIGTPLKFTENCLKRSDHTQFWAAGAPAAIVSDSGRYDNYPWYHEEGDTLDKLSMPYMRAVIQTSLGAASLLAY